MAYNAHLFFKFAQALKIDSKERGIISLGNELNGAQHRYLNEIQAGFERGQHEFIVLKARQLGMSTISLALDLYWVYNHVGLSGALVTHDEASRDAFRTTMQLYRSSLPDEWQREIIDDNRNQLVLENGSRLRLLVAGTTSKARGSSKLGRSGALVSMHATETAYWGDFSGVDALRSSFAQHNPERFMVWESTANGFNGYRDMWMEAQRSQATRAIFISWWAHELYSLSRESDAYRVYWGPKAKLTSEERAIAKAVKKDYDVEIDDMRWAWYRYMAAERITDESQLAQEFPHLPEQAFIATGRAFFRTLTLTAAMRSCKAAGAPKYYRIETGAQFWQTRVIPAREQHSTLSVWREPVEGAWYALGCDPAYGSNPDSDQSVVSVWRVWYNRAEQVAEFSDRQMSTHAIAWVMAYLAGWYGNTTTNLEINGPGQAVLQALKELQRMAGSRWEGDQAEAVKQVVRHMRQYIFRKPDTFNGMLQAWHTKTTEEIKERIMNSLRDYLEREILVVRSAALVSEMQVVVRENGSAPGAGSRDKDDRVVGAALAVMAWHDQMRAQLLAKGVIWDEAKEAKAASGEAAAEQSVGERMVQNYFLRLGILPKDAPPPKPKISAPGRPEWNPAAPKKKSDYAPGVSLKLPEVRGWR